MTEMLHHWVTGQACRRPDAAAIRLGEERLCYGELDILSNQLARALKERHGVRGDRIGLLLPKGPLAVVCLLGIYKADGIAVPLDAAAPVTALARVLAACEVRCLLAAASLAPRVRELLAQPGVPAIRIGWLGEPDQTAGTLPVSFRFADIGVLPGGPLPGAHRGQDAAHILFDFAANEPQGVISTHAGVIAGVEWARGRFRICESDRLACQAPLTRQLALWDLFSGFASGAESHFIPGSLRAPEQLAYWLRATAITQWSTGGVILQQLAAVDTIHPWDFPELRRVLWGGGHPPSATVLHWMKRLPHVEFAGLYEHAEAGMAACHTVRSFPDDGHPESLPLGQACRGQEILLLDQNLQAVRQGGVGDLYVRGSGLSPGYWRDAAASFRAFPILDNFGRVFRTGERGWRGPGGEIYRISERVPATDSGWASLPSPSLEGPSAEEIADPAPSIPFQRTRRWRAWEEQAHSAANSPRNPGGHMDG